VAHLKLTGALIGRLLVFLGAVCNLGLC
jgi:hypothetical protein